MSTVINQKIHDSASFKAMTGESHELAGLYFFLTMDCLVDLAYKISCDFFKRPQNYTQLRQIQPDATRLEEEKNALPRILAELHSRYGSNEFFPSTEQRDEIYIPIFGRSANQLTIEESNFPHLRDKLIGAATAFAERTVETGVEPLRESFRDAHRAFREYLTGLQGDSVKWSRDFALSRLTEDISYTILRNKGVASVFAVSTPPGKNWPYVEDSNGDKLVENISKQLTWSDNLNEVLITRENFSSLQRSAIRGAEAITSAIDFKEANVNQTNGDLDLLITKCYTWGTALKSSSNYKAAKSQMQAATPSSVNLTRPSAYGQ